MAAKSIRHRSGSAGGYLVGRKHTQGGIKAINKSNDQPLEMEGGEVVITAPAVEDPELVEFEGKKMTKREVLSAINVSGGGVAFAKGGDVPGKIHCTGKKYKYGGKTMSDYDIVKGCGCKHEQGGATRKKLSLPTFSHDGTSAAYSTYKMAKGGSLGASFSKKLQEVIDANKDRFIVGTIAGNKTAEQLASEKFLADIKIITPFTPQFEINYLTKLYRSEEREGAIEIASRLADIINKMPATYGTEKQKTDDKIVYLHYFYGGSDWYIIEKDKGSPKDPVPGLQHQMFGYAILNGDLEMAEWGYISAEELKDTGKVELDFHFEPIRFGDLKKKWEPDEEDTSDKAQSTSETEEPTSNVKPQTSNISQASTTTASQQTAVNAQIRSLVSEKGSDRSKYSAAELSLLKQYEGAGAEKKTSTDVRILDQFFTPMDICAKMWGLVFKHGFSFPNSNILEPAVGSGRFLSFIPADGPAMVRAYDVDEIAANLCKVLYPSFDIRHGSFEQEFFKGRRHVGLAGVDTFYDLVIGNPPYREYVSEYAPLGEKKATGAATFEAYFIARGIDVLKSNGLLCYIIPNTFLSNDSKYNDFKEALAKKAELIDAYRLPNGVFGNTDVGTDIIVLRKK